MSGTEDHKEVVMEDADRPMEEADKPMPSTQQEVVKFGYYSDVYLSTESYNGF